VAAFILLAKAMFGYWVIMWIKYTMMRIRIDHMLAFNWKFLTPLAFTLLMATALLNTLLRGTSGFVHIMGMLFMNFVLGFIVFEILRSYSKRQRERVEAHVQPATA